MAHFRVKKVPVRGGFNLNNNNDKVNSYFSYQFTRRNNFEELFSNRLTGTDGNIIRQSSYTTYPGRNHYAGGGIDYSPTKNGRSGLTAGFQPTIMKVMPTMPLTSLKKYPNNLWQNGFP